MNPVIKTIIVSGNCYIDIFSCKYNAKCVMMHNTSKNKHKTSPNETV